MSKTTVDYSSLSAEVVSIANNIKNGNKFNMDKLAKIFFQICMLPEIKHLKIDNGKKNASESKKRSVFVGYHQRSIGVLNIYEIFMKVKYPYMPSVTGKLLKADVNNVKIIKELESNLDKLEKMKNHPSLVSSYDETKKNIEKKLSDERDKKIVSISLTDCLIISEKVMNIMASENNKQLSNQLFELYNSPNNLPNNSPNNLPNPGKKEPMPNIAVQTNKYRPPVSTNLVITESNNRWKNESGNSGRMKNDRWKKEPRKKDVKKVQTSVISEKNTMGAYDLGTIITAKLEEERKKNPKKSDGWTTVKSKNSVYVPPSQRNAQVKNPQFVIPFKTSFSKSEKDKEGYTSLSAQLKMKKLEHDLMNPNSFPELIPSEKIVPTMSTSNVWENLNIEKSDDVNDWYESDSEGIEGHESKIVKESEKKSTSKNTKKKNTQLRCYTKDTFYEPIGIEYSSGRLIVIVNGVEDKWTMEQLRFYDPSCFAPVYEDAEDFMDDYENYGDTFNNEDDDYIYVECDSDSDSDSYSYSDNMYTRRLPYYKRFAYSNSVIPLPIQYMATEEDNHPVLEKLCPNGFVSYGQKCMLRVRA